MGFKPIPLLWKRSMLSLTLVPQKFRGSLSVAPCIPTTALNGFLFERALCCRGCWSRGCCRRRSKCCRYRCVDRVDRCCVRCVLCCHCRCDCCRAVLGNQLRNVGL